VRLLEGQQDLLQAGNMDSTHHRFKVWISHDHEVILLVVDTFKEMAVVFICCTTLL
jgi:hypothetical protein